MASFIGAFGGVAILASESGLEIAKIITPSPEVDHPNSLEVGHKLILKSAALSNDGSWLLGDKGIGHVYGGFAKTCWG